MSTLPITEEKRVALLIDFENIKPNSLREIVERAAIFGMVTVKRAYADWSTRSDAKGILTELGIEAIHHFRSTRAKKNASDICLTVDAMDLLYRDRADAFVLVTADSDFVRVVRRLREDGKTVVGMGSRGIVSQALISVCDRYLFVEELAAPKATDQRLSQAERLVLQAVDITVDENGMVLGSRLHQAILKLDPSFDYKDHKWNKTGRRPFKTFGEFLRSLPSVRAIHDPDRGGLLVTLKETKEGPVDQMIESTNGPSGAQQTKPGERPRRPGRRRGGVDRRRAVPTGEPEGLAPGRSQPAPPSSSHAAPSKEAALPPEKSSQELPSDLRRTLLAALQERHGRMTQAAARSLICRIADVHALRDLGFKNLRELAKSHQDVFAGTELREGELRFYEDVQT